MMKIGDRVVHGDREWILLDVKGDSAYIAMDRTAGCRQKRVPLGSLKMTNSDKKTALKEARAKLLDSVKQECNEKTAGMGLFHLVEYAKSLGVTKQVIDKAIGDHKSAGMQTMQIKNAIRNAMIKKRLPTFN